MIISEIIYIYLAYFSFMTLNEHSTFVYVLFMLIAPVIVLTRIFKVGGLSIFLYLLQLCIYGYAGGYLTFIRYREYIEAKDKGLGDKMREYF